MKYLGTIVRMVLSFLMHWCVMAKVTAENSQDETQCPRAPRANHSFHWLCTL